MPDFRNADGALPWRSRRRLRSQPGPCGGRPFLQRRLGRIDVFSIIHLLVDRPPFSLPGPFKTDGTTLTGEAWTVAVADGWTVEAGPRPGPFVDGNKRTGFACAIVFLESNGQVFAANETEALV